MDVVAADALEEMMDNSRDRGVRFLFAGMKGPVRDLIQRAGWDEKYGDIFHYPTLSHALKETEKAKR
jgi:SulP family sulfate permease